MKILQINKFYYRRGGAENHFFDLIDLLKSMGHEVAEFAMRSPQNLPSEYARYFSPNVQSSGISAIFSMIYARLVAKRRFIKLIQDFKPTVAHFHLAYNQLSPNLIKIAKQMGLRTVLTVHDWKIICPNYLLYTQNSPCERCKNKKYWQCARYQCAHNSALQSIAAAASAYLDSWAKVYDNVDVFIAPSNFVKNKLVEFGIPTGKIQVLENFLPLDFPIADVTTPVTAPRFAYVGRLSPEKGIVELVNFWLARAEGKSLDIYGDGPLIDHLRHLISSEPNQIKVMGQISRPKLPATLRNYSAVIVPSRYYEPFGLVVLEAWSQGVPVIVSDRGALPELVTSSNAGKIFTWDNLATLDAALTDVLDPELRTHALSYIHTHHRASDYYQNLAKIYNLSLVFSHPFKGEAGPAIQAGQGGGLAEKL